MSTHYDSRQAANGSLIFQDGYCDQPYVVVLPDGAWLCVTTIAAGHEGTASQHIIATRSTDRGLTWSTPVAVEPPGPPEASYATLLLTPAGRVYAFYNHNTDNTREVISDFGLERRVDTQGHFVFKYSDDGGRSWSDQRYEIPIRLTQVDRDNPYGGSIRYFWHVGKPCVLDGAAYITHHKVGRFGVGFMSDTEGWFLRSANILTEPDPNKITWQTLPEGEVGLRAPENHVSEEQSVVPLSDGSLFCVYRTIAGSPACSYSRDGGRTWSEPQFLRFASGRQVKHPRAANFVWQCSNGRYLYWFHNHGQKDYAGRNPGWLSGGREADGPDGKILLWSEPEIALYLDEPSLRMSYPDLVEQDGQFWLTETQKTEARVHTLDPALLRALWGEAAAPVGGDVLAAQAGPGEFALPALPKLEPGTGFSIQFAIRLTAFETGAAHLLFDSRAPGGQGLAIHLTERGTLYLSLSGQFRAPGDEHGWTGLGACQWESDAGLLQPGAWHDVTVIVDGGPRIVLWVIDGLLCDGGAERTHGWGRLHPHLYDINGSSTAKFSAPHDGAVRDFRIYKRPLLVNEAVVAQC